MVVERKAARTSLHRLKNQRLLALHLIRMEKPPRVVVQQINRQRVEHQLVHIAAVEEIAKNKVN
jgi:hypothetical protein